MPHRSTGDTAGLTGCLRGRATCDQGEGGGRAGCPGSGRRSMGRGRSRRTQTALSLRALKPEGGHCGWLHPSREGLHVKTAPRSAGLGPAYTIRTGGKRGDPRQRSAWRHTDTDLGRACEGGPRAGWDGAAAVDSVGFSAAAVAGGGRLLLLGGAGSPASPRRGSGEGNPQCTHSGGTWTYPTPYDTWIECQRRSPAWPGSKSSQPSSPDCVGASICFGGERRRETEATTPPTLHHGAWAARGQAVKTARQVGSYCPRRRRAGRSPLSQTAQQPQSPRPSPAAPPG